MKPRPFDYARPDSADEAIALLTEYGDEARVLAGGQSLMAMMNLRLADPSMLIDIARIPELDAIRDLGGRIEVGAAVTQNKLLSWPKLADKLPLVAVALPCVGHFQTRNKGTVCGSIAHADPSSELPLSLALLEGEVVLRSKRGTRTVGARSFQIDMMTTAREPDELIIAVRFPVAASRKAAFREVARRHGDFAIIAIGAVIEDDKTARIGIGGIASKPVVRRIALDGAAAVKDAIDKIANELEGYEDLHASAELRRDILRNLAPVVIDEALACAA
jgi:2-furoyl-CoA dehydrogenase FAD binding subunit